MPPELPASIFVSTHIPAQSPTLLAELLSGSTALPVAQAIDGQAVEQGRVYVAASDRRLLLIEGIINLEAGPRENMVRPRDRSGISFSSAMLRFARGWRHRQRHAE